MERGFQTGWKKITGKPQHGNFNPNWKDCLDFLQKAIANNVPEKHICPDIPVSKGLGVNRDDWAVEDYWYHMYQICLLYKDCVKVDKRAKRDGLVLTEYNNMMAGV